MKVLYPVAMLAIFATAGPAAAQSFHFDARGGSIAVGEPRPDRGGRDWDRGRDHDRDWDRDRLRDRDWRSDRGGVVFVRTMAPRYRTVMMEGRPCRITITTRVRANGTRVTSEKRSC
jgi:hypothetical protein